MFITRDDSIVFEPSETPGHPIFGFPLKCALERGVDLPDYDIPPIVSASIDYILNYGNIII